MSFITKKKKNSVYFSAAVLNAAMPNLWSEIPVPNSGNQPSHILLWERQKLGLHVRTESMEDAAGRTFQVKCCSEISVHILGSGLQQNHLSPSGLLDLKFSTENRQPTSVVSKF